MSGDLIYIKEICERYAYPEGTYDALAAAYEKTKDNGVFWKLIENYKNDAIVSDDDWKAFLSETAEAAKECNESEYTVHLLALILMSPHLKELYERAGIGEDIFYDSLGDLKWKLLECIRMHGIFGTFVAHWHVRFYRMNIFSLGRLQFEIKKFGKEATVCGVSITPDTTVIGVHIPSSGKLVREEYLESYARAEKFFSYLFPAGKTIFICNSWMLFPEHKVMLPETSGIRIFTEDYSLVEASYSKPLQRPWPIFYNYQNSPADQLPTDTSLERAYAERYKKGLPSGMGLGVIIYENGKTLNTEKDKMV